jgi:hypothetical protein
MSASLFHLWNPRETLLARHERYPRSEIDEGPGRGTDRRLTAPILPRGPSPEGTDFPFTMAMNGSRSTAVDRRQLWPTEVMTFDVIPAGLAVFVHASDQVYLTAAA